MKDNHKIIIGASLAAILVAYLLSTIFFSGKGPDQAAELVGDTPSLDLLDQHTDEFKKDVIEVTDGIHVAIGYAIANSILIEAPEGAIIVDTTESLEAAQEIFAAFRNITKAPIKAIIYTHNHADHMYGAPAFIEGDSKPQIWAHKDLPYLVDATTTVLPLTYTRATRQFGSLLREKVPTAFRNSGIGPFLRINNKNKAALIPPTHFLHESEKELVIAGLPLTLVHIPGETMDQIGLWIPSKKAFLSADDVYKAFPNLYAIRGTPARDTLYWARSVDKMINYEPEYLIGSHCLPLVGKDHIQSVLTVYRDSILFVHDQTVRYMNKGMFPDDIVAKVQLPKHMAEHPFLVPYYGTVEWSVRAVFDRYMGWFSGNIVELSRHTITQRAQRLVDLGGGRRNMLDTAQKALDDNDHKWSLEVASYILTTFPEDPEAKKIRLESLKGLASQQMSANGRNYYLSVALEDYNLLDTTVSPAMKKAAVMVMAPKKMFDTFALKLKAEEIEGVDKLLVFNLTDVDEVYSLQIRNSVLNVKKGETEGWNVKVTVPFETWKKVVTKESSPVSLYMSGMLKVEGGLMAFKELMGYFDSD